jgi:predicted PurR-regulated permease PerM
VQHSDPNGDTPDVPPTAIRRSLRNEGVTVTLSVRTIVIVLAIWLAFWTFRELTSTLLVFAVAILLAAVVDRPIAALERRGVPRGLGILFVFLVLLGILVGLIAVLIPLVANEIGALGDNLTSYQSSLNHVLARHHVRVPQTSTDALFQRLSDNLATIAGSAASIGLGVGRTAIAIFATLVMAFMLAGSPTIGTRFAGRFLDDAQHARLIRVTGDIQRRIAGWARGQVLVAATFGLLFGLALRLIGVPYATTLGLTAGILEFVPYLGGAITLILAMAIALTIGIPTVIGVIVAYTVLINIESHILAPKLVGDAVGLPPVVVLGALLIGLEAEGIVGVLLAVPMALIISAIIDEFWPERRVVPREPASAPSRPPRPLSAMLSRRRGGTRP